ncbi:MAG: HD family phosphohydrolase [Proteobacteria bacterium]|nr:HD family phosphohydrolase [Pseudomonadota bacterium]
MKREMTVETLVEMRSYPELREILENDLFLSMNRYRHHGNISCLKHTLIVADITFRAAKKKGLDLVSATRGALLHDFYLYDWHTDSPGLHGFKHPYISRKNAERLFSLNPIENNAIVRHMWPLTPIPPKYPESFLVCMADKAATLRDYKKEAGKRASRIGLVALNNKPA